MDDEQILIQYIDESLSNLAVFDQALLSLEKDHGNLDLLQVLYRAMHTIKGSTAFFSLPAIEKLTHETETILQSLTQETDLYRAELIKSHKVLDLFFDISDHLKLKIRELRTVGLESLEVDFGLLEQVSALGAKFAKKVGARKAKPKRKLNELQQKALASLKSQTSNVEPSTPVDEIQLDEKILIKPSTLETISELNSELLLARNQMSALLDSLEESNNPLLRIYNRVDSLSQRISDRINQIRLQPFSLLTEKLHRVVRDLAKKLDKDVDFRIKGKEIEIDRQVLEGLKDPLLHIIRNSLDHGIETREERVTCAKNSVATLLLEAEVRSNQVIVRVSDDGRGIDREKVLSKAIKQRIINSKQAKLITDEQVYDLIFSPGFSTRDDVDNISGRGIGLDVVRSNLSKMNARVSVDSVSGRGTEFELLLPLTLISDSSLIFEIQGEVFAIPQSCIQSISVLPTTADLAGFVEQDDEKFELLDLSTIIGLHGQSQARSTNREYIIVEAKDLKYALVIDSVIDLQNVVIKNLPIESKATDLYSGATILPDGSVALILDPEKVFSQFKQSELVFEPKLFFKPSSEIKQSNKFVSFYLNDFCFALDYHSIREIASHKTLTRLPGSKTDSLINLHDSVVLVKDLASILDIRQEKKGSHIDIILGLGDYQFALQADDIDEIFVCDEDAEILPEVDPLLSKFSSGVYRVGDKELHLLDEFKILSIL